jgi:hypothetical protein
MKTQALLIALFLLIMPTIVASSFEDGISSQDKATFDQMLEPIVRIYDFVKYSATIVSVLVLLFAGVTYMIAGDNPSKKEQAKNMITYVIVGLVVIWAAPMLVNFVIG